MSIHLMHGHAGVQVPPLHAPSAEMAACMCIAAEKIQTGKLCYWQLVTVRGKNNHTASQKKKTFSPEDTKIESSVLI